MVLVLFYPDFNELKPFFYVNNNNSLFLYRLHAELKDLTLDSPNAPNVFHGFVTRAKESKILVDSF